MDASERIKVFTQLGSRKVHSVKDCSITANARYQRVEVEMTQSQLAYEKKCTKCWN